MTLIRPRRASLASLWSFMSLLLLATIAPAQDQPVVDSEWILRYEQAWGVPGLYIDEPPARDSEPGRVRHELIRLTRAARAFQEQHPGEPPSLGRLLLDGYIAEPPNPPDGADYLWDDEHREYRCSAGGAFELAVGARRQLRAAEDYRTRVIRGSTALDRAWLRLQQESELPDIIRREIELRQFILRLVNSPGQEVARATQDNLAQLTQAMATAVILGELPRESPVTMQDIARTGLIDILPPLPAGGQYVVTRTDEPPRARFGNTEVVFDPDFAEKRLREDIERALAQRPNYPPALALLARIEPDPEQSRAYLEQAIATWPDIPGLRIQRLTFNARDLRLDELEEDIEFILLTIPAAPLCIEIDLATRQGPLADDAAFRWTIARVLADVRPEVLALQLVAIQAAQRAGDTDAAAELRARVIDRHPGYRGLI